MLCNVTSKGIVLMILLSLGLATCLSQPAWAEEEVLAFWEFDGIDFLADSSGNGYDLTSLGNVTQVGNAALFADGLLSTTGIDLSPYRQVTLSWDMESTGGAYIYELTDNFHAVAGGIAGTTDGVYLKGNSVYNADSYTATTGWHSYKAVYDLDAADVADVVKVYEDGVEIGSPMYSSTSGNIMQAAPPANFFGSTSFNIGAHAEGYDPLIGAASSFLGQIDNFKITGELPPGPTPGLVAHFQFDDNLNNTIDSVAATTVGTTPETMYVAGPTGIAGKAVDMSGADWYINCGSDILTSSETLTVAAWIYDNFDVSTPDDQAYFGGIVMRDAFQDGDWGLRRYSLQNDTYDIAGRVQMLIGSTGNENFRSGANSVPSGEWVHLAATYTTTETGSEISMYINGVLAGTTVLDSPVSFGSTKDILIGYDAKKGAYFDGLIADVRVYNEVLDAEDILAIISPEEEPIAGDANRDGKVDGSDVTILAGNWQAGVGNPNPATITWDMGDFNGDGQIDGSDVTILAGNWQAGVTAAAAAVPEPSAIVLLLMATVSMLIWKRR